MKLLVFAILICLAPYVLFAQEPDATTGASPPYSAESASDESGTQTLEELKQSLEQLREEFKNIEETQEQLKADRQKLKETIVNSNEIATIKLLNSIATDCESFREEQSPKTYPKEFADLSEYIPEKIIKATDASSAVYGYYYEYKYVNRKNYTLKAYPATKGTTGERTFVLDETGRIINEETGKRVTLESEEKQRGRINHAVRQQFR